MQRAIVESDSKLSIHERYSKSTSVYVINPILPHRACFANKVATFPIYGDFRISALRLVIQYINTFAIIVRLENVR